MDDVHFVWSSKLHQITIPDPCLCCHFRSQATSSVKMTGRVKQRLLNGQIFCFHVWNVYPTVCKRVYVSNWVYVCKSLNGFQGPRILPEPAFRVLAKYMNRSPPSIFFSVNYQALWAQESFEVTTIFLFPKSEQKHIFPTKRIRISFWLIIWYCKCLIPNFPHSRRSQQRSIFRINLIRKEEQ